MKALEAAKLVIASQCMDGKQITHLSLQKLLFYCHAYHLAFSDLPLVEDEVAQAWTYGPVFQSVYNEYSKYGSGFIPQLEFDSAEVSPDTLKIITLVLSNYGNFSAMALVNLTHQESPWMDAYVPNCNKPIDNNVIKDYYSQFINKANAN